MADITLPYSVGNATPNRFGYPGTGGLPYTAAIDVWYDPKGLDRELAKAGLPPSNGMEQVGVAQPQSSNSGEAWRVDVGVYDDTLQGNSRRSYSRYLGATADGWKHQWTRVPIPYINNREPMPGTNAEAPFLRVTLVDGQQVTAWLTGNGNLRL